MPSHSNMIYDIYVWCNLELAPDITLEGYFVWSKIIHHPPWHRKSANDISPLNSSRSPSQIKKARHFYRIKFLSAAFLLYAGRHFVLYMAAILFLTWYKLCDFCFCWRLTNSSFCGSTTMLLIIAQMRERRRRGNGQKYIISFFGHQNVNSGPLWFQW